MINSEPPTDYDDSTTRQDAAINAILPSGAKGAVALAGIATAWLAFYLLVFVPRAVAP